MGGASSEASAMEETPLVGDVPADARISVDEAVQIARKFAEVKEFDDATKVLEAVLKVVPNHATALNYLSIIRFLTHGAEYAAELLERAVAAEPDSPHIRNNLGNAYVELNRIDEAVAEYEAAIALMPDLGDPYANLSAIMTSRGDIARAEELLRLTVTHAPRNAYAHHNLGVILMQTERPEEAIQQFALAARHAANNKYKQDGMIAMTLWLSGKIDEAREFAREWVQRNPGDAQAQHVAAAFTGENVPARAHDVYVRNLFDDFAASFDAKLDSLGYQAPGLVSEALAVAVAGRSNLRIVDAGCGTGKCAVYLKPLAAELIGVDLSPGMLERAKLRNAYDRLEESELTAFIASLSNECDAIVSADTLCYFGQLEDFTKAAAGALRPGGVLVFTVESMGDAAEDFKLAYNGRYAHSRHYVEKVISQAGLKLSACADAELRMEFLKPVAGLLVTATKPG